jgi:hypothetical protein
MKFKVGQKWVDGLDNIVTVVGIETGGTYPVQCNTYDKYARSYTEGGVFDIEEPYDKRNLVKLLEVEVDANAAAAETLQTLGWTWDGQCWVESEAHPLKAIFEAAINQATHGKGQRHGGATVPFLDQPIFHYAKMHGRGFLTGQAAKKLEEAASTRSGTAFETEVLGALVYAAAAIIFERG